MSGIVEIVVETPCLICRRLARYTVYHRANAAILARLGQPVTHRAANEIVFDLENLQEQVSVGVCACGVEGGELTSAEFAGRATREDLLHIADDHSYEVRRISLDGQVLWESDLERHDRIMAAPDPTPDQFLAAHARRMKEMDDTFDRLLAGLERMEEQERQAVSYIQAKALEYCVLGADGYRAEDALGEPDVLLGAGHLAAIDTGMRQFAAGRGFTPMEPLEGIPAAASHALMRVLHFDVIAQHARRSEDGLFFVDALHCQHMVTGHREIAVFSRVPTRRLIDMLENAREVDQVPGIDPLSGLEL